MNKNVIEALEAKKEKLIEQRNKDEKRFEELVAANDEEGKRKLAAADKIICDNFIRIESALNQYKSDKMIFEANKTEATKALVEADITELKKLAKELKVKYVEDETLIPVIPAETKPAKETKSEESKKGFDGKSFAYGALAVAAGVALTAGISSCNNIAVVNNTQNEENNSNGQERQGFIQSILSKFKTGKSEKPFPEYGQFTNANDMNQVRRRAEAIYERLGSNDRIATVDDIVAVILNANAGNTSDYGLQDEGAFAADMNNRHGIIAEITNYEDRKIDEEYNNVTMAMFFTDNSQASVMMLDFDRQFAAIEEQATILFNNELDCEVRNEAACKLFGYDKGIDSATGKKYVDTDALLYRFGEDYRDTFWYFMSNPRIDSMSPSQAQYILEMINCRYQSVIMSLQASNKWQAVCIPMCTTNDGIPTMKSLSELMYLVKTTSYDYLAKRVGADYVQQPLWETLYENSLDEYGIEDQKTLGLNK